MALRKKQKADKEGESRRKLARQNFSEGQQRFHEHKKKQVHIIIIMLHGFSDVMMS